jgi:LPS-assembly protein
MGGLPGTLLAQEGAGGGVSARPVTAGEWRIRAFQQEKIGSVYKLRGTPALPVEIEDSTLLMRAVELDYDEETGEVHARGNVYFHHFEKNEQLWADRVDYNTDEETGTFYNVRGETHPKIVARPGTLVSDNPFHFEGEWAQRLGTKYVLHNGFITNCKIPRPWWRLRGKTFDIIPGEQAVAHNSTFVLRRVPIFYTPFFYHSLEKVPRKSGFLLPMIGNSSRRGVMLHAGYFWAINRSYDVTYQIQAYPSRGQVHYADFRGKPRVGTDYDVILYGVQDRGLQNGINPPQKFSGLSMTANAKSDLGKGWTARVNINYITSFRFRQEWSSSFNEAVFTEIHSVGFLNKNFANNYTVNVVFSRLENFQSSEIPFTPPGATEPTYLKNAITIRKLPEAEFTGRDRAIFKNLPIYFGFETSSGFLARSQPVFNSSNQLIDTFQTPQFTNRSSISPHVTGTLQFAHVRLVPSFGIQETYYGETQTRYQDRFRVVGTDMVRSARTFSLDIVLPSFERVFNKKTILGDKLKHVVEPRATYRYVTGIGADYSRFIRFDENDLISNTNELLIGLTNRLYAKRGNSIDEIFTWELYQKRYFDPTFGGALVNGTRNVFAATADLTAFAFLVEPRSTSPVVSMLRASPVRGLGVQWQADYDHRVGGIIDSSISVDYRFRKYFISAGHNEVRINAQAPPSALLIAPANQFRGVIAFGDPNHKGFNAGFVALYDYRQGLVQYTTSQVTYNTDCCGLSFQVHRYNIGPFTDTQFRVAFAVANISTTLGNLKKQDRMF